MNKFQESLIPFIDLCETIFKQAEKLESIQLQNEFDHYTDEYHRSSRDILTFRGDQKEEELDRIPEVRQIERTMPKMVHLPAITEHYEEQDAVLRISRDGSVLIDISSSNHGSDFPSVQVITTTDKLKNEPIIWHIHIPTSIDFSAHEKMKLASGGNADYLDLAIKSIKDDTYRNTLHEWLKESPAGLQYLVTLDESDLVLQIPDYPVLYEKIFEKIC